MTDFTLLCSANQKGTVKLIIDIGNSAAKLAIFHQDELIDIYHDSNHSLDSLPAICRQYPIEKGILSTVIPLSDAIKQQLGALKFEILHVSSETALPIRLWYKTPETLGSDRIAAVVGAWSACPGKDLLVIDAGTCLTYEFIDAQGNYHGGNISPGKSMRLKALHAYTAKLPLVGAEGNVPALGYDTETAIRSGAICGMEFEICGYITRLQKKYPGLLVFLTGGDEFSFDTNLKNIIFADKFLVLKGLNRILEYNDKI